MMRWKKQDRNTWRSDEGYTILHSNYGLAMYHVRGPEGQDASGIGGSSDLPRAKQMAERHLLRKQCAGMMPPVTLHAMSLPELQRLLAQKKEG